MNLKNKFNVKRVVSGLLASIMLSQAFIYGDGTCKGLLHTDTIQAMATTQNDENSNQFNNYENRVALSGYVNLEDNRNCEIKVSIFDENWNTLNSIICYPNQRFELVAENITGNTTHIKVESNGYLPRFYKDMGFGSYQLGTESNPEVLLFGDTTYNPDVNNQWSDEVIDTNDLNFVYQQEGKIKGDENYNEYYDFNQDGRLDNEDIEKIAQYDGAIYENDVWYTSSTKEYYYTNSSDISKYDLNGDNIINSSDQQVFCDLYPYTIFKGNEDFAEFAYMDIDENGVIDRNDCEYFETYINRHNGCNPYNDYIYNLTLTGDSYHNGAMYLENTNLDLADYELYVNGNFVFRTANPYNSMWNGNPEVDLNINGGTLFIADQFDFGQANSYDKIIMTNDNGKLYINGIWNYITLADMEGFWTAGNIYFFGSTWQVNEASGDKSIYSTGTHSICFYYQYGQQVIRWANTQDCIYNEETGEYNTLRRFNFDYKDNNGKCLGVTFPCGYSDDKYYFRASLPKEIVGNTADVTIPYEDWDKIVGSGGDIDNNTIPDIIDDQIQHDDYESIPNEWLQDKYGDTVDEFLNNNDVFSEDDLTDNKKTLIDFLYYLYDSYDQDSAEFENAMEVFNYFKDSLEQIVLGDYTDKTTIAGTGAQIIISILPTPYTEAIDLVFDLRDLSENFFKNFDPNSPEWWMDLTLDGIGLIPEVGTSIKQLKKLDNLTGISGLSKFAYNKLMKIVCDDNGKFIKNANEIADITTDFIKDIDRLADNSKEINTLIETKGAEEIFETYFKYGIDLIETLCKYKEYYDEILNIIDTVNELYNSINKTSEIIEFIKEYGEIGIEILNKYGTEDTDTNDEYLYFYSVQNKNDSERLTTTGTPWPTGGNRANLGDGVYAWGNLYDAENYLARKSKRTNEDLYILKVTIKKSDFEILNKLDMTSWDDIKKNDWFDKYAVLYGGTPTYEYDYIKNNTHLGIENYFSKYIFSKLNIYYYK